MHPMLNIAVKAARRAGAIINRASFQLTKIGFKKMEPSDYISEIYQDCEKTIFRILQSAYPDHSFSKELNKGSEFQWIVDPLNGSMNFIKGISNYVVSIALLYKNQVIQSVIYDPSRDELFTASRGCGAFLNDSRIRVSNCFRYQNALLGISWPISKQSSNINFLDSYVSKLNICCLGSAALSLAYVAAGRFDGFFSLEENSHEIFSGYLLVLEAGGLFSDFDGNQLWLENGNILAATPKIFSGILSNFQSLKK